MPDRTPGPLVLVEERIDVPAEPVSMDEIHNALARFWKQSDHALSSVIVRSFIAEFNTAFVEIATNIIRHAYSTGAQDRCINVRLRFYANQVEGLMTDKGSGFDRGRLEDASVRDNGDFPEGGRGIKIAIKALDRLSYHRTAGGANCWQLVKRFTTIKKTSSA